MQGGLLISWVLHSLLLCVSLSELLPQVSRLSQLSSDVIKHQVEHEIKKIVKQSGMPQSSEKYNVVFAICESTAVSAYFLNEEAPMPIPNIRWAQQNGVTYLNHYVVAPVCCPSRATIMASRHAHHVPHTQKNPDSGLLVDGAWNNHEGLDADFDRSFMDALSNRDVRVEVFGKKDWYAGNHSVDAFVTSLGNKVNFPYILTNGSMGWYDEDGPVVTVKDDDNVNGTEHQDDWDDLYDLTDWITHKGAKGEQWFAQFSPSICHPSYKTTTYWMDQVDKTMISIPEWIDLDQMHEEDFCQAMKKKMVAGDPACCTDDYKVEVRQAYYANVAEYDRMIGEIISTLKQTDQLDNTWIILTSDHGDMQMEHQQYYKMVHFESSTHVPLIIVPPASMSGLGTRGSFVSNYTQSIDFYPSILEMAGVPQFDDYTPEGKDLVRPFIFREGGSVRDQYAVSQFHGDEVHLSWYMIVKDGWKYVVYGSGKEVPPRLYNVIADPMEMIDYGTNPNYVGLIEELDSLLREIIDYPSVSTDVERYNKDSYAFWRGTFDSESAYEEGVSSLRWKYSWEYAPDQCLSAIDDWLYSTPNDTYSWSTCPWQGRPKSSDETGTAYQTYCCETMDIEHD